MIRGREAFSPLPPCPCSKPRSVVGMRGLGGEGILVSGFGLKGSGMVQCLGLRVFSGRGKTHPISTTNIFKNLYQNRLDGPCAYRLLRTNLGILNIFLS